MMFTTPIALTAACLAAVAALVASERARRQRARPVFKLLASSAFVALAWVLPGSDTDYGRLILVALALSWAGDALLLSSRSAMFVAGLAAFLAAHLAFATAFSLGAIDARALAAALVVFAAAGAVVLRWLWPHLSKPLRAAVGAYVVAIGAMCALAVASSAASGNPQLAIGAIGFAASDLAVAREQFVRQAAINKTWGLPAYYLSQLVLAWSV